MKWKPDVTVERKRRYMLSQGKKRRMIAREDYYLVDAMEQGITDERELNELVVCTEKVDSVIAGFRLAQFIVDYGEYISNQVGHCIIEP